MDLALLVITALGFMGVYLMMPRERITLVRLGALASIFALGGLFLYLVRLGGMGGLASTQTPPIYFYLFAAIMIAGSVGVITHPRPVYAALYFVLVTLAGAGLFVMLLAQFMAVVLIIVYAGAILVTYVFVLMLASPSAGGGGGEESGKKVQGPRYDRLANSPLVAVLLGFILLGTVLQILYPRADRVLATPNVAGQDTLMMQSVAPGGSPGLRSTGDVATTGPTVSAVTTAQAVDYVPGNIQVLGVTLYRNYAISLEIAGLLLTIALVGAVVIARKDTDTDAPGSGGTTGSLPVE